MESSSRIRPAQAGDLPAIQRLWERFMSEEEDAVPDADQESARARWADRLRAQADAGHVLVAEHEGQIVGFVGCVDARARAWVPEGVLYIVDIYVAPEARSTGAAGGLMRALEAAAATGFRELWTNTHLRNRRVQVLLRRAGFSPLEGFALPGLEEQLYYRKELAHAADVPVR